MVISFCSSQNSKACLHVVLLSPFNVGGGKDRKLPSQREILCITAVFENGEGHKELRVTSC